MSSSRSSTPPTRRSSTATRCRSSTWRSGSRRASFCLACTGVEGAAIGGGRGADGSAEVVAQGGGIAEAANARNLVDRGVAALEQLLGLQHTLGEQPLVGAGAHLGAKAARESARRDARMTGQVRDRERLPEALQRPGARAVEVGGSGRCRLDRVFDELRLPSLAVWGDDAVSGYVR